MVRSTFCGILALVLLAGTAFAMEVGFAARPTAKTLGDKVQISFALSRPTDVAVFIEDSKGNVVRHLVAGVLGENPPEPLQPNSLSQTIEWDGKDDLGRAALPAGAYGEGGFKVRVSAGMKPQFIDF